MLIDTHAHLTDKRFEGEVQEIIKKSYDSMVEIVITSGTNLKTSKMAVSLAEEFEGVFASIGVHPQDADEYNDKIEKELEELAQSRKVIAIGEIGLEYLEGCVDREVQKQVFERQIKLAYKLDLPIVIHTREAIGDTMEILKANKELLTNGGTLHCFSESEEIAKEAIKLGLNISVGGVSTFTNAKRLQEVIKNIPIDKIILETDCPYLAPTPFRGQRNDPSFIPYIAQNLADLKGLSVEEVAKITTLNARRLFKI